ncbi:TPA: hypothetical protein DCG61_00100 [Patescibacteria group bacterium]|jgi:hypothetical protein|nr:hypothetical protein [Patescibacteria group bacterium]
MKFIKILVIIGFVLVALNPVFVFAQETNALPTYSGVDSSLKDYLCTPSEPADGKDLERCINRLYRFSLSAGALVLVFFLVLAGYLYITSGETGKGKAKSILMNSLVGIAILGGSYMLLYFINPSLVAFKPIQPPIFDAEPIPGCEEVGFGSGCLAGDFYDSADMPSSSGCKSTFASESEARANMVTFSVPAWKLSGNTKSPTQYNVTVQRCLEQKVKAVFQQIYDSPEKPPINDLGSFTWRQAVGSSKLSTHSFGLTFDINWKQNYYIKGNKRVGDYWRPCPSTGCDLLSLPINGTVVRTFKAAGFGWGGEWRSLKDYMHFSCHPKEQGKCF